MSRHKKSGQPGKKRGDDTRGTVSRTHHAGEPVTPAFAEHSDLPDHAGPNPWPSLIPSRAAGLMLALAFLLRFPDLGVKSLWVDEMVDWGYATGEWSQLFQTAHWATYALQKLALMIYPHEFMLRLPCATFGFLGVWWTYVTARIIAGERAAIIAGLMMAVSPFGVYYSQDSHYYGMVTGLSVLAMLSLVWMLRTTSVGACFLMLGSAYFAYKSHPAAAFVPVACMGAAGGWMMTDRRLIRRGLRFVERFAPVGSRGSVWGVVAVIFALLLVMLLTFDRRIVAVMLSGSRNESTGTPNFEISFAFFAKVIGDFLGGAFSYTRINLLVALFVLIFSIAGFLLLARKNRWLCLYFLLLTLAPWIALSVKKFEHFFHDRYVCYMVPGLLLCASVAVDRLGEAASKTLAGTPGMERRVYHVVVVAFFLVWGIAVIPNLVRYYPGEKQDWKGAVEYLRDHAEPNARIANYLHANQTSLTFYLNYFGITSLELMKVRDSRGVPGVTLEEIKRRCREPFPLYFISSYQRYEPAEIFDWIREHSDKVFDSPTLHPHEFNYEEKNVELYKFRYPGRFVQRRYAWETPLNNAEDYDALLLFDKAETYTIQVEGQTPEERASKVRIMINGALIGEINAGPGTFKTTPLKFETKAGESRIQVTGAGLSLSKLRIEYAWQKPLELKAGHPSALHPSVFNLGREDGERRALVMKRNSVAAYDVELPAGSGRYLEIEGRHDAPAPVLLEVAVNGTTAGFLGWAKGDNSWESQGMPFSATEGTHRIELSFLNEGDISADLAEDDDRDAWLNEIRIFASPSPGDVDDRILVENLIELPSSLGSTGLDWSNPTARELWTCVPADRLEFLPDPFDETGIVAKLSLPAPLPPHAESSKEDPALESVYLKPPVLPASKGQILHFSVYYRMERLENHSANLLIVWYGDNDEIISQNPANSEGITEANTLQDDFGWIRTVAVEQAPEGARWVMPVIWVHANGRQTSQEPGALYVKHPTIERAH